MLLLFRICLFRLGLSAAVAASAALLFLLHPFHDQAVLWVAGRTDVLCTLLYLTAFDLTLDGGRFARARGCLVFAAALAAKEMAATLPLVVLIYGLIDARGGGAERTRIAMAKAGSLFGVLAVFVLWRAHVVGGIGGDPAFRTWNISVLKSTAKLLQWLFVPWDVTWLKSVLRARPLMLYVLSALWLAAVGWATYWLRHARVAFFAAAWVLITLIPVHGRPHAWYLYLPSIGACVVVAVLVHSFRRAMVGTAVTVAVALACAVSLYHNAKTMRSAGDVAASAVTVLSAFNTPVYVVNAPIVLGGRIPVLTAQDQYNAAVALFAAKHPLVVPMNYVYVDEPEKADFGVTTTPERIDLSVATGPNTFFTLDGVFLTSPPTPTVGLRMKGPHATYTVVGIDPSGKISRLSLTDLSFEIRRDEPCLVEFRAGAFRSLRAGCVLAAHSMP